MREKKDRCIKLKGNMVVNSVEVALLGFLFNMGVILLYPRCTKYIGGI